MLAPTGAGAQTGPKLPNVRKSQYGADEQLNDYDDVTGYNNFYEFGTDKADPKANAPALHHAPLDHPRRGARQGAPPRTTSTALSSRTRSRNGSTGSGASRGGRW